MRYHALRIIQTERISTCVVALRARRNRTGGPRSVSATQAGHACYQATRQGGWFREQREHQLPNTVQ